MSDESAGDEIKEIDEHHEDLAELLHDEPKDNASDDTTDSAAAGGPEPKPAKKTPSEKKTPDSTSQIAEEEAPEPEPEKPKRVSLPKPTPKQRWGMNPEDRLRVMEACAVLPRAGWIFNFTLMMTMSVLVAIMGLSANSPALVIGAMLIAPLMTPVLGIAASVAMALGDAVFRSAGTVLLATFGAIGAGFVISGWLPDPLLTNEVLARTAPDARDLVVALAAGLAGSYATARPDVSSSLPGVAIAVALVPPLAVVGITLRAGEPDLALGALLLYGTNLAAIVTVSTVVFIAAGFVPGRRLASEVPRVLAGGLVALALIVSLGFVIVRQGSQRSAQVNEIREATAAWIEGPFNQFDVAVDGKQVAVTVTGPTEPPSSATLRDEIAGILGEEPTLDVTWISGQTGDSLSAQEEERSRTAAAQAATQERAQQIQSIITEWLSTKADPDLFDVAAEINTEDVALTISSTIAPPERADLQSRLQQQLGETIEPSVVWNDLSTQESQRVIDETRGSARAIVQEYASAEGVILEDVTFDGSTLVADLAGDQLPDGGAALSEALADLLGDEVEIKVFFDERVPIVPVPTATPEPTPTPAPTATPVPTPTPQPTVDPDAEADSEG